MLHVTGYSYEHMFALSPSRPSLSPELLARVRPVSLAKTRTVPLGDPWRALVPDGALRRGSTVVVEAPIGLVEGKMRPIRVGAVLSMLLAMLIAILRHEAICTILPPSAVRRELESGELCAHPIVSPSVTRRLFVIYSADRALTDREREFVSLLRSGLSAGGDDLAQPLVSQREVHQLAAAQAALH